MNQANRNPQLTIPPFRSGLDLPDLAAIDEQVHQMLEDVEIPVPASIPDPTSLEAFKQWVEEFVGDVIEGLQDGRDR